MSKTGDSDGTSGDLDAEGIGSSASEVEIGEPVAGAADAAPDDPTDRAPDGRSTPKDAEGLDGIDLTPPDRQRMDKRNPWPNRVLIAALLVAAGFVLFQALTSARVYFRNVDEAIAERSEAGDSRLRVRGFVVDEPMIDFDGAILFSLTYNNAEVDVRHIGPEPNSQFVVGEDVVVVGSWEDEVFVSTEVQIKHSEEYVEDNSDRFEDSDPNIG